MSLCLRQLRRTLVALLIACILTAGTGDADDNTCAASSIHSPTPGPLDDALRWSSLTSRSFAQQPPVIAILPLGSIEQHGPHLPVGTDMYLTEGVVRHALKHCNSSGVVVLPTSAYGASFEHGSFPGTLAVGDGTLGALWADVLRGVANAGVRKVVVVNGHGGQSQNADLLARTMRFGPERLTAVVLDLQRLLAAALGQVGTEVHASVDLDWEATFGIHAGLAETSVMLHMHPDLVDLSQIKRFGSTAERMTGGVLFPYGKHVSYGWKIEDLNKDGAVGNAAAASADIGKKLVDIVSRTLAQLIDEVIMHNASPTSEDL